MLIGLCVSLDLFAKASRLAGTGMFAGLGEAIIGVLFLIVAADRSSKLQFSR